MSRPLRIRARLRGDVQPHSPFGQRHGPKRNCSEYAAHSRAHRAGIQPAPGNAGCVLGRSLSRHRHRVDEHLHRCVVYIDLNMVRAGVVNHPVRRDTVVRPVDKSRKRGEPLPAARLVWPRPSIHLLIPQDQIHSRDNVGRLRNHLARQSLELVAPTGSGFQPRFSAFNPLSFMQLSKTCRWVPRSAKGFEPFSCYRGFTRQKGISGSAISFAASGDGWPVREACVVRVLGGGEKNKWTAVSLKHCR